MTNNYLRNEYINIYFAWLVRVLLQNICAERLQIGAGVRKITDLRGCSPFGSG